MSRDWCSADQSQRSPSSSSSSSSSFKLPTGKNTLTLVTFWTDRCRQRTRRPFTEIVQTEMLYYTTEASTEVEVQSVTNFTRDWKPSKQCKTRLVLGLTQRHFRRLDNMDIDGFLVIYKTCASFRIRPGHHISSLFTYKLTFAGVLSKFSPLQFNRSRPTCLVVLHPPPTNGTAMMTWSRSSDVS